LEAEPADGTPISIATIVAKKWRNTILINVTLRDDAMFAKK